MNKSEANRLIDDLDWNATPEETENAMERLVNLDDDKLYLLLQPRYDKRYWYNAAIVISKIGYPRIESIIPGLLRWLQDMNWPGALKVVETLQKVDRNVLIYYIEQALTKAKATNDTLWITWIKEELIELLEIGIEDFINKSNYRILQLSEW